MLLEGTSSTNQYSNLFTKEIGIAIYKVNFVYFRGNKNELTATRRIIIDYEQTYY